MELTRLCALIRPDASPTIRRDQVLRLAVEAAVRVPGNIVEFGVYEGDSTRVIARTLRRLQRTQIWGPRKKVFACDSFEGLTEPYENAAPGTFACRPPRIRGVNIVKGFFDDTLTPELARQVGRVALASLDADLFGSTLRALTWLTPLLGSGSLLLFDEFLGGDRAEQRAYEAWLRQSELRIERIATFAREPAGWGTTPDERVLFRVAGPPQGSPVVNLRDIDLGRMGRAAWRRIRRGH